MADLQHDGDDNNGDSDHFTGQPRPRPLSQPSIPKLPNECLYHIIGHLWDDPKTLYNLLLVNKFFFHAALPLLMDQPLLAWNLEKKPVDEGRDQLFVLLLVSLLYRQQCLTGKDAASILAEYGLQLVVSTRFPLLQPFFCRSAATLDQEQEKEEEEQEQKHEQEGCVSTVQQKSPLMVDYAKYWTTYHTYTRDEARFYRFIRLIEIPDTVPVEDYTFEEGEDGGSHRSDRLNDEAEQGQGQVTGDEETGPHSINMQEDYNYKEALLNKVGQMLLDYNVEFLTGLRFHVSKAHYYLPFASKLASLQEISLTRDNALPDQHLQDTLAFIRINRSSFPQKPCLRLEFDEPWCINDDGTGFASLAASRRVMSPRMESKLELYKMIG
ncbi:hypothetical protein BGW39_009449 [Mortierella sp. 14UC]|nr:hypothetical protein BGW39_009449 [Mortierella sp. 14UC]